MAEYIKRDDAKKAILEACGCDYSCMVGCNGACDIHAGSVWGAVDNIPAADVRENVRGEWLKCSLSFECTVCGFNTGRFGLASNYCPHCGASMKGEAND